jgi:RHS repeat-associated protein
MMGVYRPFVYNSTLKMEQVRIERYFAGTRLNWKTDRLGSRDGNGYFPYGEERGAPTTNDTYKFATYWRDQTTGLDYADQRYYASTLGRFLTPDPYRATSASVNNPADPRSWNRCVYVLGDSVNYYDPTGRDAIEAGIAFITFMNSLSPPSASITVYGTVGAIQDGSSNMRFNEMVDFTLESTGRGGGGGAYGSELEQRLRNLLSLAPEACTFSLMLTMECGDDASMAATLGWGALSRITGTVGAAWWVAARAVGAAGEAVVARTINLARNTAALPSGRIPDFWSGATIYEVKNASHVSLTGQIWDMAKWAAMTPGGRFELWVREGATLSDDLITLKDMGLVVINTFKWP